MNIDTLANSPGVQNQSSNSKDVSVSSNPKQNQTLQQVYENNEAIL